MKHHRFAILTFAVALLVASLPAFGATSLLTPDGVRYAIVPSPETPQVEIARAEGVKRARLIVPSTQDVSPEYDPQLAFDPATNTLFVVWSREGGFGAEVRYSMLKPTGEWSIPRLITAGSGSYRGIQLVLTHPAEDPDVTLLHAGFWSINGSSAEAQYALFAFESGRFISGAVQDLESLASTDHNVTAGEYEDTGNPLHPALALERAGESVDAIFGSTTSTAVTRVTVSAQKIGPNVRIWKPVGRTGTRTERTHLTSTDPTAPVHGLIRNGKVALYTVDEDFSFVVLLSDGAWSPIRTVRIDDDNTADDLLRELQRVVEEMNAPQDQTEADQ